MRNQLIPTQVEGGEAATARTGKFGNLRSIHTLYTSLNSLSSCCRLDCIPAQVFHSIALYPGQVQQCLLRAEQGKGNLLLETTNPA